MLCICMLGLRTVDRELHRQYHCRAPALYDLRLMTREFLLGTKQAVSFRDSSNDN